MNIKLSASISNALKRSVNRRVGQPASVSVIHELSYQSRSCDAYSTPLSRDFVSWFPETTPCRPNMRHGLQPWIAAAAQHLHHNVLVIALANKRARIAWSVQNTR